MDLWPALEDLFSAGGPVSRCWCMYWRIGGASAALARPQPGRLPPGGGGRSTARLARVRRRHSRSDGASSRPRRLAGTRSRMAAATRRRRPGVVDLLLLHPQGLPPARGHDRPRHGRTRDCAAVRRDRGRGVSARRRSFVECDPHGVRDDVRGAGFTTVARHVPARRSCATSSIRDAGAAAGHSVMSVLWKWRTFQRSPSRTRSVVMSASWLPWSGPDGASSSACTIPSRQSAVIDSVSMTAYGRSTPCRSSRRSLDDRGRSPPLPACGRRGC